MYDFQAERRETRLRDPRAAETRGGGRAGQVGPEAEDHGAAGLVLGRFLTFLIPELQFFQQNQSISY